MKRIFMLMSIFSMLLLLSGCVSIPLGDGGTLELSKDGLSVDEGEVATDSTADEPTEVEVETETPAEETETETETPIEETEAEVDEKITTGTDATATNSCEDLIEDVRGNERHIKKLIELTPDNYPVTDCMIMREVNEEYRESDEADYISSEYRVEGYWADVTDEFIAYLKDNGFKTPKVNESASQSSATIRSEDADYDINLTIDQVEQSEDSREFVRIRLGLYHYDTTRLE